MPSRVDCIFPPLCLATEVPNEVTETFVFDTERVADQCQLQSERTE